MARGKRPRRGGKRKFDDRRDRRPKPKKGKFDIREASYVKERDAKNATIESRRKRLMEEKESRRRRNEQPSSEEEDENHMTALLATFSKDEPLRKVAIESESDSSEEDDSREMDRNEDESDFEKLNTEAFHARSDIDEDEAEMEDERKDVDEAEEEDEEEMKENKAQAGEIESKEEEEEEKEENEEDPETGREDNGHVRDPFSIHLNRDLSIDLYNSVSTLPPIVETSRATWPILGAVVAHIPTISSRDENITGRKDDGGKKKICLLEEKEFAIPGSFPSPIERVDWNALYVKSQIQNNIATANEENIRESRSGETDSSPLTRLQRELFSVMNNYQDLLFTERTFTNASEIRFAYCLHAINHALKTRSKVLHHNAKLSRSRKSNMVDVPDEYRDQGLVRPKILMIVPFRHSCLKIVECLVSILIGVDPGGSVINKKRFFEDFAGNEISMPRKNPKPEDYELTFTGNTDDTFRIGLSITKKTLKLYSDFYSSDIIIASPLGLRMLIGAEGEEDRDYDFLASIELLILDQTEIFVMQNWDHFIHVLDHVHLQPKSSHDADFSRVRCWCVNGWTKYYRQTLIFSAINLPEIQSIYNKKCHNYAGKLRTTNPCLGGSVRQVIVQVPQVFHKFRASSSTQAILEARFAFFVEAILPQYRDTIMNHTLIFVPSYFDFVKLRNYFKKEELSFAQVCEYSRDAKIARARDMFFHSDAHFLLYSERFHFFRRVRIKGIRHLIFFEPPIFPHHYDEMCNLMQEANQNPRSGNESNMSVTTIYSKYDALRLAAVVGDERAKKMIASERAVHMLMTGE